jgi:nitrite reductase/ring-hydroxylating ferredoxin subunit
MRPGDPEDTAGARPDDSAASSERRASGPEAGRVMGLDDLRASGPEARRNAGLEDRRAAGPDDRLSVGPDGRPWEAQPKWRRDFPIDWPRDEYVSRRDFTKYMVLVSLGFVVGQFWILAHNAYRRRPAAPVPRRIADLSEVPVGSALNFSYPTPQDGAVLVRLSSDRFVAYDRACTHLLCPVIAQPEFGRLHCPCHEGVFDLETGRPIAGPPERPLPRIRLEVREGAIYATGIELRTV